MHFDWYQATIDADPKAIIDFLGSEAGERPDTIKEGRGRHNYASSTTLLDQDGNRIFEVLYGGKNGHPNCASSGRDAQWVADAIRSKWPSHRVTRMDIAQDVVEEGAYERLEAVCRDVSRKTRVKGMAMVPEDVTDGRTYYLGSKASDRQVRLYDKTAEARAKSPHHVKAQVPDHWTRIELQIRPKKDFKEFAANLDPDETWFTATWTAVLARRVLKLDMNRIKGVPWTPDGNRALHFMVQQYGRHLEQLARDMGGWAQAGEELGRRYRDQNRHKRR